MSIRRHSRSAGAVKTIRKANVCNPIEALERRTLLTATLEINSATHALSYSEVSGFANDTTVQVIAGAMPMLQITEGGSDLIAMGTNATNAGWTLSVDSKTATGPESSASSILVDTNDGPDVVVLKSADVPVTVSPTNGATDDEVDIGGANGDPGFTEAITSSVNIQNATGKTSVVVDDVGDPTGRTISVTDTGITGLTALPITYDASANAISVKTGNGANSVTLNNASAAKTWLIENAGTDTDNVQATALTSALVIEGVNSGHPSLNVTNNGSVADIKGPVMVDSPNLLPSVIINGSADTTAMNVVVANDATVTGLAPAVISFSNTIISSLTLDCGSGGNTIKWNWNNNSTTAPPVATINAGAGSDTVDVLGTRFQNTLTINGQSGTDAVNLGATPQGGDAVMLLGTVNITNPGGPLDVTLDDSLEQLSSVATINDTGITGLTTAPITYTSARNVNVVGETLADTFNVTPSATTAFSIDGGPFAPAASPTDILSVDTSKGLMPGLSEQATVNGLSGAYTFSNRQSITFSRIGTVSSSISGKAFAILTGVPIASAVVFLDLNHNNTQDMTDPATTTDASGNYTFSNVTPGQYTVDIVTTSGPTPAPVTVTVGAGQNAIAPSLLSTPITLSTGPDLSGAFVGAPAKSAIGGTKVKARLRIINASSAASVAAGSPLIALYASADNTFDPSDTLISTLSAGKLNLRHGASKTVPLSFAWPTTLSNGHYFLVASIDPTNVIAETSETNNSAATSAATAVAAPFVDLSGAFAHPPKSLKTAKASNAVFTISNLGNIAAAGTIAVDIVASTDQTLDGSDTTLASHVVLKINIPAHKSRPAHVRIPAGATVTPGNYFIIAALNSTQSLTESDFTNNDLVSATVVAIS